MTSLNYLTKTELPTALNAGNLSSTNQQAIINQLIADGLYSSGTDDGRRIWIESDTYLGAQQPPFFNSGGNPNVPGVVSLLEVEGQTVNVKTDSTLKVIVDDGTNSGTNTLNVTGNSNPELIVLGNSNTVVNLSDHGNDTVLGGTGNDTINANNANDLLIAGSGDTKLVGGSGHDTLVGGSGHDTIISGAAAKYLAGGPLTSGHDTLIAGTGPDTITGVQGDYFDSPTMAASGGDIYNIYGSGGASTINLTGSNDTVNFFTTGGKDTINSAGGVDTVDFTHSGSSSLTDIKSITAGSESGDYLIKFKDGQSVEFNAHSVSHNTNAFVLEFTDGTLNLRGGT